MGLFGFKLKKESKKNHILCDIKFAIPYFDVFDSRLFDFGVPCAVHGNMVYGVDDIDLFKSIMVKSVRMMRRLRIESKPMSSLV